MREFHPPITSSAVTQQLRADGKADERVLVEPKGTAPRAGRRFAYCISLLSTVLLLLVPVGFSVNVARAVNVVTYLEPSLDPRISVEHGSLLTEQGRIIDPSNVYSKRTDAYSIMQVRQNDFCLNGKCLTIIVRNCGAPRCHYTSILSGKSYIESDEATRHFGGSITLIFDADSGSPTRVVISGLFTAVQNR